MPFTIDQIISVLVVLIAIGIIAVQMYIAQLPAAQQAKFTKAENAIAKIVSAVEQAQPQATGLTKKSIATNLAEDALKFLGIDIPATIIEMLIESAVFAINESKVQTVIVPTPTLGTLPAPKPPVQPQSAPAAVAGPETGIHE
jgi:hypothetical protein